MLQLKKVSELWKVSRVLIFFLLFCTLAHAEMVRVDKAGGGGGVAGSQTPWTSDIDGAGYNFTTVFTDPGAQIYINQTSATGIEWVSGAITSPLIVIDDNRAGTTADELYEATLWVATDGAYSAYFQKIVYFGGQAYIGSSSLHPDGAMLALGTSSDVDMQWDTNSGGDDLFTVYLRHLAATDTSALWLASDYSNANPNGMTDHDNYVSPTIVWAVVGGADANDYAAVVMGERTQADVAATHYFDFYAMTGALDGAADGTTTEIPAWFRFGDAGQANILTIDTTNDRVGILTAAPSTALEVTGTVTATEFVGGGAGITGLPGSGNVTAEGFVAWQVLFSSSTTGIKGDSRLTYNITTGVFTVDNITVTGTAVLPGFFTQAEILALANFTNYFTQTQTLALSNFTNYFTQTQTLALANLTNYFNRTTDIPLGTNTSGNYVASVATTAPLTGGAAGSEGAIITVVIPKATSSADGYLNSTDWSTFNNKVSWVKTYQNVTAGVYLKKCNATNTDSMVIDLPPYNVTLDRVEALVKGGTNITFSVQECDRNATVCVNMTANHLAEANIRFTNTTFTDATVDADNTTRFRWVTFNGDINATIKVYGHVTD